MSKRQLIKYVKLHTPFFTPELGTFKDSLPPANRTLKEFKMWRTDSGSLIVQARSVSGATLETVEIPTGNIALMAYAGVEEVDEEAAVCAAPAPAPAAEVPVANAGAAARALRKATSAKNTPPKAGDSPA